MEGIYIFSGYLALGAIPHVLRTQLLLPREQLEAVAQGHTAAARLGPKTKALQRRQAGSRGGGGRQRHRESHERVECNRDMRAGGAAQARAQKAVEVVNDDGAVAPLV